MQIQGALLYADQKQEGVRQGFRNERGNVSVQARGQGEPPVDKWHRDESQQKLASRRNFWDYQARYGLRKNKEERPWESICGDHAGLAGLCLQKGFWPFVREGKHRLLAGSRRFDAGENPRIKPR